MDKPKELSDKPVSDIEEGELSDEIEDDKGSYYETISSVGSSSAHEKEASEKPCTNAERTHHKSRSNDEIFVLKSTVLHPKDAKHEKENLNIQKKQHDNKRRRKRRKRSCSLKIADSDDEYFRGRKKKRHERKYSEDRGYFRSKRCSSSSSENHKTHTSLPMRRDSSNRRNNTYYFHKRDKICKRKKDKDLIKRVISKSGPSNMGTSQDNTLMKKLLGSGSLGSVPSRGSTYEMHYFTGVSSPDIDLFGDISFSGDTESVDSCGEQKPDVNNPVWNTGGTIIVDTDDSEIEVIIPEKKVPELIDLNSDDDVPTDAIREDSTCNSSVLEKAAHVNAANSVCDESNTTDSVSNNLVESGTINSLTSGKPVVAVVTNSSAGLASEEQVGNRDTAVPEEKCESELCTLSENNVDSTNKGEVIERDNTGNAAELVKDNITVHSETSQKESDVVNNVCNSNFATCNDDMATVVSVMPQENETKCQSSGEYSEGENNTKNKNRCMQEVSIEALTGDVIQNCKVESTSVDGIEESSKLMKCTVEDGQNTKQEDIEPGGQKTKQEKGDKADEDEDLMKLRLIALNSSKEKSKEMSDTEEPKNQVQKKQEDEELELRMAALKSAILKKHKERLQKGVFVKKNKFETTDKSLDIVNDDMAGDSGKLNDMDTFKPLSQSKPASPSEVSLQGEEDMEIDSDPGGEILEDNMNNEGSYVNSQVIPNSEVTDVFQDERYCAPSSLEPPPPGLEAYSECEPPPPGVDLYVKCPAIIDLHWSSNSDNGFRQFCIPQLPPPPPPPPLLLPSFNQTQLPPPPPPPVEIMKVSPSLFSVSINNVASAYSKITNTSNSHSSISSGSRCYHSHEPLVQTKQEVNNSIYVNLNTASSITSNSNILNQQELTVCGVAYESSSINSESYLENFIGQPNRNDDMHTEVYEGETVNNILENNSGESSVLKTHMETTNTAKTKSVLRPNLVTVPIQANTNIRANNQLKKPLLKRKRRRKNNNDNNLTEKNDINEKSDVPDLVTKSAVDNTQETAQEIANTQETVADIPKDLEGMIVLDEVGWSPDENNHDTSKSLSDKKESFEDIEEDENILRARALTSLASSSVQQVKRKQVNQTLIKETLQPKPVVIPYQNYVVNNGPHNVVQNKMPIVTRTVNFNENSRYRLSRIVNNETRRSVTKGNSLQVMIPTGSPAPMSPQLCQVSPPQVPRLVINVGADSDSDDDDDDNSDWTRIVTIRDEDKKQSDTVTPNINQRDIEKSVEMFLMSVRKQHEIDQDDNSRADAVTKTAVNKENSDSKENQHGTGLHLPLGTKQEENLKSKQQTVEVKQLKQQPRNQYSKVMNSSGMLRDVLSNEMHKKNLEKSQFNCDPVGQKDAERRTNQRVQEEELYENSKSGAESSASECSSHKIDENTVLEGKRKQELLDRERKRELQVTEKELVEKRYTVIDTLSEMQQILGDYEIVKEKLETYEEQITRLRNELAAAEEKLDKHKKTISEMKNEFFTHHAKMFIVSSYCDRLEKKCGRLGGDILGTQYALPETGKKMLTKKLQQVIDKQRRLDLTDGANTDATNRVRTDVTHKVNTANSTNTNVTNKDKSNSGEGSTNRMITPAVSTLTQVNTDMRVQNKIVRPVATKLSLLARETKVPLKQAVARQGMRQVLTRMPPRFSKNFKYSRQLMLRYPQRGRGRSTRVLNLKHVALYPETSKPVLVPPSGESRFCSSEPVTVSTTLSSSPRPVSSTSVGTHENNQQPVEQKKSANTSLPVNSKISASSSIDSSSVDPSGESIVRLVKYDCVAQEITRSAKPQMSLQSTSRLKDYKSPLLHLHNSVDHGGSRDVHSKILCPYELMGSCRDEDCTYLHHKDYLPQSM